MPNDDGTLSPMTSMLTPPQMSEAEIDNVFATLGLTTDVDREARRFVTLLPATGSEITITVSNHTEAVAANSAAHA